MESQDLALLLQTRLSLSSVPLNNSPQATYDEKSSIHPSQIALRSPSYSNQQSLPPSGLTPVSNIEKFNTHSPSTAKLIKSSSFHQDLISNHQFTVQQNSQPCSSTFSSSKRSHEDILSSGFSGPVHTDQPKLTESSHQLMMSSTSTDPMPSSQNSSPLLDLNHNAPIYDISVSLAEPYILSGYELMIDTSYTKALYAHSQLSLLPNSTTPVSVSVDNTDQPMNNINIDMEDERYSQNTRQKYLLTLDSDPQVNSQCNPASNMFTRQMSISPSGNRLITYEAVFNLEPLQQNSTYNSVNSQIYEVDSDDMEF